MTNLKTAEQAAGSGAEVWQLMDEIVTMHNDLYHPGPSCPSEDEDGGCSVRTGKPAVSLWTDRGVIYTEHGKRRLGSGS